MLNWLNNFQIEKISFFIGFFSAIVFWFVAGRMKKWIPEIKKYIIRQRGNWGKFQSSGILGKIYNDAYSRAQSNHLLRDLFRLDEILIKPKLLVESTQFLDENSIFQSEICDVIPYIPDFPVLSRNFNVPRISLLEAIQNNADIAVCGLPGSGKTVALADLVMEIILNSKSENLRKKIPLYFDINDFNMNLNTTNIIDFVSIALSQNIPGVSTQKITKFIQNEIESNNCIIILDGLDELPVNKIDEFIHFIGGVKKSYPDLQFVLTISPTYYGNLFQFGFSILFLSAWSNAQIREFYCKLNNVWNTHILQEKNNSDNLFINSLIRNWTESVLQPMNPLEYTLFIWGSYAGDLSGSHIQDLMSSYINRVLPEKENQMLLSSLAKDLLKSTRIAFPIDELKIGNLDSCINSGIVFQTKDKKIKFRHAQLLGFMANIEPIDPNFDISEVDTHWTPNLCFFGFLNIGINIQSFDLTNRSNISFLLENIFKCSYFLKYSSVNSSIHNNLLKMLISIIQDRKLSFPIRLRGLAGIIESNDPNILVFTKQLLSQSDENYKKLALFTIGCFKQDLSLMNDVIALTNQGTVNLEKLAFLVLSTFNNELALHELGKALLGANEKVRRIIAETLAFDQDKGEEILKEATTIEDIVVRRSAIYGLLRLDDNWAKETLRIMMIEDSQWVIRNAASQAIEFLEGEIPFIPKKNPPIHENTWINTFAGKNNLGVSPEKSASRILLLALSSDDKNDIYQATKLSTIDNNNEIISKLGELSNSIDDQRILERIFLTLSIINNSQLKEKHPD